MGNGLFDSPLRSPRGDRPSPGDADDYRSLSGAAIAAAAVALISPVALFGWSLLAVPAIGGVLATVALREIARRPEALTGRPLASASLIVSTLVLVTSVTVHAREYTMELPEGFERLSYASLQPAEGESAAHVPEAARGFDGRRVLLKGYMYPGKQQAGITQFLLVRDQGDCCFGGNPKITDRVLVQLDDPSHPAGIEFTPRLTKVAGRFRVEAVGSSELAGGVLYHIDDAFIR